MVIQLLLNIFIVSAFGIVGGENVITPSNSKQLCQIMPIRNGQYQYERACSATIVGQNKLLTAGHCGDGEYKEYLVDCLSGDQFITSTEGNWKFLDSQGPLNPMLKVKDLDRVGKDQAILTTIPNFSVPGLPMVTGEKSEELLQSGQCFFQATGTNDAGEWGVPQKVPFNSNKIRSIDSPLVFVESFPQVQAHDSGGAVVCNDKVVAVIVGQKTSPSGSIITTVSEEFIPYNISNMTECRVGQASKAVKDSIEHILGFEEVRHFLQLKERSGSEICYEGLTIGKNSYQYFLNLIVFEIHKDGKLQNRMMALLQSASVQAHHSTGERPWVILNTKNAIQSLHRSLQLGDSAGSKLDALATLSMDVFQDNLSQWPHEEKVQPSSIYLGEAQEGSLFLTTWLKELNFGNNIFTSQVSPQFGLILVDGEEEGTSLKQGSAFSKVVEVLENEVLESQGEFKNSGMELNAFLEQITSVQ